MYYDYEGIKRYQTNRVYAMYVITATVWKAVVCPYGSGIHWAAVADINTVSVIDLRAAADINTVSVIDLRAAVRYTSMPPVSTCVLVFACKDVVRQSITSEALVTSLQPPVALVCHAATLWMKSTQLSDKLSERRPVVFPAT